LLASFLRCNPSYGHCAAIFADATDGQWIAHALMRGSLTMEMLLAAVADEDIVGIVISRGSRAQDEPRFSMYVWGPADPEPELPQQRVA
jgi:hypothetical protein